MQIHAMILIPLQGSAIVFARGLHFRVRTRWPFFEGAVTRLTILHKPQHDDHGNTMITICRPTHRPLPRPTSFSELHTGADTSPTCQATAGTNRPAAGTPSDNRFTPSSDSGTSPNFCTSHHRQNIQPFVVSSADDCPPGHIIRTRSSCAITADNNHQRNNRFTPSSDSGTSPNFCTCATS